MATENDDAARRALDALLRQIAAEDLPELIAEARRRARERVVDILAECLTEQMLHNVSPEPPQPAEQPQRPQAGPTKRSPASPPAPQPPPAAKPQRETTPAGSEGLYVLCVTEADVELPAGLTGVTGDTPYTVQQGTLAAVVCRVPLAEFEEERLRENLQDLTWLEGTARAHEAALERLSDETTLIPMRLCTVYRSDTSVREMLVREQQPLADALHHLENKSEWGVKVFATGAPEADPELDASVPKDGTDYMRRRREDREQRTHHDERLYALAAEIHDRLSQAAEEALSNPPQRQEVSGHHGEMVLNGVYLVEDGRLNEFLARVEELREQHAGAGLEVEPTGPWPAYNFVPGTIGAAW